MSFTAFLSSSFSPDDGPVVEKFRSLLEQLGIDCYQARNVPDLHEAIFDKIAECDLFIAVLTPRDGEDPSSYVSLEVGVALGKGKNIIIFREDSVPVQRAYAYRNQKEFRREALLKGDPRHIGELGAAIKEHCSKYGIDLREPAIDRELERRYQFAKDHAQQLGTKVLGYFNDSLYRNKVRDVAAKNFPTDADHRANKMIISAIESDALTHDDGIVSEESFHDEGNVRKAVEENEFTWIIDPLDGTLNFAYGFPYFCVSIGLLRNKEPVMGVLYHPPSQELYGGLRGKPSQHIDLKSGVRRNIHLQSRKTELRDSIVMTHLSSERDPRRKTIGVLDSVMESCRSVRVLGSGQMALLSVALGQFDVFFNYQTNIWDIVPGYVIIKGAGGYVTSSLEGDPNWNWRSKGVVAAANPTIGAKFKDCLRAALGKDFPTLGR
jgi:myo-inositol-1(or 4)-monophosphatase